MLKLLALAALLLPSMVAADALDDLFAAVEVGDDAVEELIRGTGNLQDQNFLLSWLGASDPDLRDFVRNWAEREPDNAVALTAFGWSLLNEAYLYRGGNTIQDSWPASLERSRPLFQHAFAASQQALEAEPEFDAAALALIAFARPAGLQDLGLAEAERLLAVRPSGVVFTRAIALHSPAWGGSVAAGEDFCEKHLAVLSAEEALDLEGCLVLAGLT